MLGLLSLSSSLSTARSISLRAPIANEGDRARFQERLALTLLVVGLLAFGFWLATVVSLVALAPNTCTARGPAPPRRSS